jgi:aryl-alcohol dehydrogenase-like predicted oxidoreductase
MKYNLLGGTGLLVSELCLGTMTFGGKGVFKVIGSQNQDVADNLVRKSVDAGIGFEQTRDCAGDKGERYDGTGTE